MQSNHPLYDSISEEMFDMAVEILKNPFVERIEKTMELSRQSTTIGIFGKVDGLLRLHRCQQCLLIKQFESNREMQRKKYMGMNPIQSDIGSKNMINAYLRIDKKFYEEVYCVWCGNLKQCTSSEIEIEEFKKHYRVV